MRSKVILWAVLGIGAALLICEAQQILALQHYRIEDAERSPTFLPDLALSALDQSGMQDGDVQVIAFVRSGNTVRSYRVSYENDDPGSFGSGLFEGEDPSQTHWMPVGDSIEVDELAAAPAITPVSQADAAAPGL